MRAVPSPPFLRRLVKGLPVTAKMMPVAKRKFGCLMGMLPPLFTKTITDWCLENIPDFHLGPGGREFRSHVTVKFGFTDSSPNTIEAVKEFFQGRPPIQVRLGGFGLFTSGYGKWKNEDGDVLFIEVDSPDLHRLNTELSAAFPCKDTHPEYKPHVTVAYLDPSVAESYRGLKAPFLNCSLILDTLEWSGADGVTEQFSLSILPQFGVSDMQVTPPSLKSLPNYGVKGRWVTMGAQEGGDEPGKHGGTRVYLGGDGKIEKGPKGTTGKKPSELSEKKPKAEKERKQKLKPPTIKKPEPPPEYDDDQVVLPDDVDDLDLGNFASEMGDVYDDDDPLVIGDGPPDSKIDADEDSVELDSDDLDTSGWESESEEQASPESAEEESASEITPDGDDLDTSGWEDLPDERAFDENAPPEEHLKAMSASVDKWLKDSDSVDGSDGLSPEQKKKYAKYANEVFAKMPAPMLVAVRKSLRSIIFVPDKKALGVVYERSGGKSGKEMEGFCDTFSGTVCVNGSTEVGVDSSSDMMKYGMYAIHGVYTHEICHTLDEDTKHSRSKEWQSAWNDEIVNGKYSPSSYSQTSPAEGFAEFGRCLVRDADLAKKWFPKCYDYWKNQGWLK